MPKNIRKIPGNKITDPSSIAAVQYNEQAGSQKVSEVGRHLQPIPLTATTYTTDASSIRTLPEPGKCLAVYNNAGAVGSIVVSEASAQLTLAPGVTDAGGHVGIPCPPGQWTYIACNEYRYVIASAATLLVFLISDNSFIAQEAVR